MVKFTIPGWLAPYVSMVLDARPMAGATLSENDEGNMVLQGVGVLIGLVCLVAMGGLIASTFTNAAALPAGSSFNVSAQTTQYYPVVVTIAFIACLAIIGIPVVALILAYFGGGGTIGKSR